MAGEFKVPLQGEQSLITLLAENEHGSSDPSSVRIRRNPTTEAHKPTLYVLAVGVAKFKNHSHLKLNFADADANAFVERIMRQEHGLYSRVLAQTLVNEQATVEAILKGLEWLERNMSPRDVAAVFFSSHGANDASRQFYLLPYEVNVQDDITLRRSALRYADLRDTLVHLAERGKTLLFRRRSVIEILHSTASLEMRVWPRTIAIFLHKAGVNTRTGADAQIVGKRNS